MSDRLLADAVLVAHLAFVLFAVLGGLLVARSRLWMAVHLPAVVWAAWVEFAGWGCPLTGLENRLRVAAGQSGYESGFVEHYLVPLLYPPSLGRGTQLALGLGLVLLNAAIYSWALRRR